MIRPVGWFWRKLTTRAVWRWERRFKYTVQRQASSLPPIAPADGPHIMVVLTTPATFDEALFSGWSWLRFLHAEFRLEMYVDGEITASMQAKSDAIFPGARLLSVDDAIAEWDGGQTGAPRWAEWKTQCSCIKKVPLILKLQETQSVLFLDYDVLAFNAPEEIVTAVQSPGTPPLYNREDPAADWDPEIKRVADQRGLRLPDGFNSGLLWLPGQSLSSSLLMNLVHQCDPRKMGYFAEQTLVAALLGDAGAQALPESRYVTSQQRQFYWDADVDYETIIARHFVWPVRHVLYRKGIPRILHAARSGARHTADAQL